MPRMKQFQPLLGSRPAESPRHKPYQSPPAHWGDPYPYYRSAQSQVHAIPPLPHHTPHTTPSSNLGRPNPCVAAERSVGPGTGTEIGNQCRTFGPVGLRAPDFGRGNISLCEPELVSESPHAWALVSRLGHLWLVKWHLPRLPSSARDWVVRVRSGRRDNSESNTPNSASSFLV